MSRNREYSQRLPLRLDGQSAVLGDPQIFRDVYRFRGMITYSLYAVIAGAVLRVVSAVESITDVGLWMLKDGID